MITERPEPGEEFLDAMTDAVVELHERHHGRKPASAKTMLMGDDLLACLLTGVYTDVEKTMIELGRQAVVREVRSTFYDALRGKFVTEVARITGRGVLAFFTTQHVGPDIEILFFLLGPTSVADVRAS